jgi:hypothetical protein
MEPSARTVREGSRVTYFLWLARPAEVSHANAGRNFRVTLSPEMWVLAQQMSGYPTNQELASLFPERWAAD